MSRSAFLLAAIFSLSACHAAEPAIHELAAEGDIEKVKALLAKDLTLLELQNDMQERPLHVAAHRDQVEMVEFLLKAGASIDAQAYNKFTPLHFARDPQIVKLLAKYGADLDAKASFGSTALEQAAQQYGHWPQSKDALKLVNALKEAGAKYTAEAAVYLGDLDRVRILLQKDPSLGKERGLLRAAIQAGHGPIVKLLLEYKADPHAKDYGDLPLIYFGLDHPEVVKILLDAGVDAKSEITYHGCGAGPEGTTLLHEAAFKGQVETAKLLIAHGLGVNTKAKNGLVPIEEAAIAGRLEMVKLLIKSGTDIRGEKGVRVLHFAAQRVDSFGTNIHDPGGSERMVSVIRYLHEQGVPLDLLAAVALGRTDRAAELLKGHPERAAEQEKYFRSPMYKAVTMDRREIMTLMLDAGASPDTADEDGYTLLHSGALWDRPEIVKLLIDHKAKVDAKNKNGATPLLESARCLTPKVAQLLIDAGADVNARNKDGESPLVQAEEALEFDKHRKGENSKAAEQMIALLRKHGAKK